MDYDFIVSLLGGGLFAGILVFFLEEMKSTYTYWRDERKMVHFLESNKNKSYPPIRIAQYINLPPERVVYIGFTSNKITARTSPETGHYWFIIEN